MDQKHQFIGKWNNSIARALWVKFSPPFLLLVTIIFMGTVGYAILEKWSLFEGLYMTVITIATVGFHEVHSLSNNGKIFTIFIIFAGIGIGGYAIGNIASFLIGGEARSIFMEGILEKKLAKLKDHIIVLGYGKFGREVVHEIARKKVSLIIIEQDEDRIEQASSEGFQVIHGDGTNETLLEKVGVLRAKGLVAAMSSEADNVFAVLTARVLNPNLTIVSRGEEEESEKKLLRAGANRVILAYRSGGRRMAAVVLQPAILDFLDVIFSGDDLSLELMEIHIKKGSPLVGKKLKDSDIRNETGGALVVGIKSGGGKIIPNPLGNTLLHEEDVLVAMGSPEHLASLEKLAGKR